MPTTPFSLRLDAKIRKRLEKQAKSEKRSAGYIVQRALEQYLDESDYLRSEIRAACAKADEGVFISQEAMHRWMESWDTDHELPPPEPDIFPPGRKA